MATTKDDIREWIKRAKKEKATHLVVVCDTFSYEDFPVFVKQAENIQKVILEHSTNMQKIMEVYNLSIDIEKQLNESRSYNI